MKTIKSIKELNRFRDEIIEKRQSEATQGHINIYINVGTCSIAVGALDTLQAIKDQVQTLELKEVSIIETGCYGLCALEPIVEVAVGESPRTTYRSVSPEVARRIMREHIVHGKIVSDFVIDSLPFPTI